VEVFDRLEGIHTKSERERDNIGNCGTPRIGPTLLFEIFADTSHVGKYSAESTSLAGIGRDGITIALLQNARQSRPQTVDKSVGPGGG
jgi:hypothetical protein